MSLIVGILFLLFLGRGILKPKVLLSVFLISPAFIDLFWELNIFGLRFLEFAYGGLFLAAIITLTISKKKKTISPSYLRNSYLILFIAFFIPVVLAFIRGDFSAGLDQVIKISFGLLSYLLVNAFIDSDEIPKILKYVAFGAVLNLVVFAFQLVAGIGTEYSEYTFGTGFYADEGTLSRKSIYVIILFFPIGGYQIFKRTIYSYLFTFFSLITLVLSVSRNAILAALTVIIIYVLLQRRFFTLGIIGLIFTGIFLSTNTLSKGLENKIDKEKRYLDGDNVSYETLGSGRIGRWYDVLEEFQRTSTFHKFFGQGKGIGPHGQFFDILRRGGLFSPFLFYTFFIKITLIAIRNYKKGENVKISLYLIQFLVVFWILSFAATPLWNFQLLSLIFVTYALLEKFRGKTLRLFS